MHMLIIYDACVMYMLIVSDACVMLIVCDAGV
jgi:hypothetical protein